VKIDWFWFATGARGNFKNNKKDCKRGNNLRTPCKIIHSLTPDSNDLAILKTGKILDWAKPTQTNTVSYSIPSNENGGKHKFFSTQEDCVTLFK
jgi:hypothetical protein